MSLVYVGCSCLLTLSDMRVNTRQKFFGDEWFGDEVVCAGFETGALRCSVSLSTQQQHGHTAETRVGPKSATNLKSVLPRKADIKQHDIGYLACQHGIDITRVSRCLQLNVAAREGVLQRPGNTRLVIDEQDAWHAPMVAVTDGRSRHD
jgi:hypothetical protein